MNIGKIKRNNMRGAKSYTKAQEILDKIYSTIDKVKKEKYYYEYLKYLRKSAYLNHGEAQFELGIQYEDFYIFGGNPHFNIAKCLYWYQKACSNNIAHACNNLAIILEKQNKISDAVIVYEKAINLGNIQAKGNFKDLQKKKKL